MNPEFELSHSRNLFISKFFLDEEVRNIDLHENIELQNIENKTKKKVQFLIFNDVLQIPNNDTLDVRSIWYTKYELHFFRQMYIRDIHKLIQNNFANNIDEARKKLCDPEFDENAEITFAPPVKIVEEKKASLSLPYIFYNESDYNADY
jgi:hypothetical protein